MNIVAIVKHISIKNSNYDAALDYLTMQHDEFTNKPVLNEDGDQIPRDFYLLDGINCNPYTFNEECQAINALYRKNQTHSEIKAHHYIISFDPRDRDENDLTPEKAHVLVRQFARQNFPGHQMIVCTHKDGHNSAGNIHVHIVLNSVRKNDVMRQEFMERDCDAKAGNKHHVTNGYLSYLKQAVMEMCQEQDLYQVDLLSPARVKITDREYWAKRRGQAYLDKQNAEKKASGFEPTRTTYQTEKEILRNQISAVMRDSNSFESFSRKLLEQYGVEVHESRGRLSYLPPNRTKPIRARMLGTDFEKDYLDRYFSSPIHSTQDHTQAQKQHGVPNHKQAANRGKQVYRDSASIRLIVDVEACIKAQQNRYYAQKVKVTNLQQMSKTLLFLQENRIGTQENLSQLLDSTKQDMNQRLSDLKSVQDELRTTNLLIRNTGQYLANKSVYQVYLNAKNKKRFRQEHEPQILLYEAARKELRQLSNGEKIPSLNQLKERKASLTSRKNTCYEDYSFSKGKLRELQTIESNVKSILEAGREFGVTRASEQIK